MEAKIRKKIVVFLSDETLNALNRKADQDELSRSTVVNQIIKKAVEKYKVEPL
jgi:metal-responsive CopG/Arc/MetJ family transcriptional regulator